MYFNLLTTISFVYVLKAVRLFDGFYLILAICYLKLVRLPIYLICHKKNPISGSQLTGSLLVKVSYKDGHLSAIVHID